jgi:hypothetical protein
MEACREQHINQWNCFTTFFPTISIAIKESGSCGSISQCLDSSKTERELSGDAISIKIATSSKGQIFTTLSHCEPNFHN